MKTGIAYILAFILFGLIGVGTSLAAVGAYYLTFAPWPFYWPLVAGFASGVIGGAGMLAFANWMHHCLDGQIASALNLEEVKDNE